jgi:KaiC/GvpD/RAD55 family RecA-like ATPase
MRTALDILREDVASFCRKAVPGGEIKDGVNDSRRGKCYPSIYWMLSEVGVHSGIVLDGPSAGYVWQGGMATRITAFDFLRIHEPTYRQMSNDDMVRWWLKDIVPEPGRVPEVPPNMLWRDWKTFDLPEPAYVLGKAWWRSMRALLYASTGVGKTQLGMALAVAMARGVRLCHWSAGPEGGCRTLYIDAEMTPRLTRERMADALARSGGDDVNDNLVILHEYVMVGGEPLPLVSTEVGQEFIDRCIEQYDIEMVIFDNVFSLTEAMLDEGMWQFVSAWIRRLNARGVGTIWIHHSGHDAGHAFGTSTRQFDLDCVIRLQAEDAARYGDPRALAFRMEYEKHRRKTPANAEDYASKVFLVGETSLAAVDPLPDDEAEEASPIRRRARDVNYDALVEAVDDYGKIPPRPLKMVPRGVKTVTHEQFRRVLTERGMLDPEYPPTERTRFAHMRQKLIEAGLAAERNGLIWLAKEIEIKTSGT